MVFNEGLSSEEKALNPLWMKDPILLYAEETQVGNLSLYHTILNHVGYH